MAGPTEILGVLFIHWPLGLALGLLGALLVLDETSVAQTWLGQPLPAGLLAGWLVGQPTLGLSLGLALQLTTLGNLPIGASFVGERVTPLLGAVAAGALTDAVSPAPDVAAAPVVGWLLLAVATASLASERLMLRERRLHFGLMTRGLRSLRDGYLGNLDNAHRSCLLMTAMRGLIMTLVWAALFAVLWLPLLRLLPPVLERSVGFLPALAPAIAIGTMLELRGRWSGLGWLAVGFLAVVALRLIRQGGLS